MNELFENSCKIKATPEAALKSGVKSRLCLGMASRPRRLSSSATSPSDDKENGSAISDALKESPSPQKLKGIKLSSRSPLKDVDQNIQGGRHESTNRNEIPDVFKFAEPLGAAPRRMSIEYQTPKGNTECSLFRSLSSGYESTDEEFNLPELDLEDSPRLPNGISKLLAGQIVSSEKPMETDGATTPEFRIKSSFSRRSLFLENEMKRTPVFKALSFDESPPGLQSCKRHQSPMESSPLKKMKSTSFQLSDVTNELSCHGRSEAEVDAEIKDAINRSTTDSNLTGDFSKTCLLPLVVGQHRDLKSISVKTLADLIRGEFKDSISDYTIVDCRYPYEYEAGHIDGALNLYTKELIEQFLFDPLKHKPEITTEKRNILIFHCEFSWERGPNLSRFLRKFDRQRNVEHYPALHYPELYLLHGGYKKFYNEEKELCLPKGYRPMIDPDHDTYLKDLRSKRKAKGQKVRRVLTNPVGKNLKLDL